MKYAHRESQRHFKEIGQALGFETRYTWSQELPTDGVWVSRWPNPVAPLLPIVALEVAVSESPKSLRGSVATLAAVSPAVGLLVIHDIEKRRCAIRQGRSTDEAEDRFQRDLQIASTAAEHTSQRIVIWSASQLARRHELATGQHLQPDGEHQHLAA